MGQICNPGTGKSPAIETVLAMLRDVDTIIKETLVSVATSSGLVKTHFQARRTLYRVARVLDILNKLLKNDDEKATGDVQNLLKLWSGESASNHFPTEGT